MKKQVKFGFIRFVAMVLMITLLIPIGARATTTETVQPRASAYLDTYGAYVYAAGNGVVQAWFDVQGTGTMDELGVLFVKFYECSTNSSNINDWEWKETYFHDTTSGMLSYNDDYHSGHVDYTGTPGLYYKAYLCVWGGEDGDGDTRYFWTNAVKAQ
ncbi:MAG: hypothetical protein ACI4AB_02965 [Acetatifactor sp.]